MTPAPEPDCTVSAADRAPRLGADAEVERSDNLLGERVTYEDGTRLNLTQAGCSNVQVGYHWQVAGLGHEPLALLQRVVALTGEPAVELAPYMAGMDPLDSEHFSCAEDTTCSVEFEEDEDKEITNVMVMTVREP